MIKTKAISKMDEIDQIKIKGIEIVRATSDGCYDKLRSIAIRDADGVEYEFSGGDCSNRIEVHIPRPPKKVEKWALVGTLGKIQIDQVYDKEQEAKDALQIIGDNCQTDFYSLKIEKREVEE